MSNTTYLMLRILNSDYEKAIIGLAKVSNEVNLIDYR